MRKHIPLLVIATCIGAFSITAHAKIYRWVDDNGKVNYTDTPPTHAAIEEHKINAPKKSSSKPAAKEENSTASADQSDSAKATEKKEQEYIIPEPDPAKCKQAESQVALYTNTPRIRALVKGETKYLDESEVAERLSNWKTAQSIYCG